MDKSGELSFPVIQLVLEGDPSLRTYRLRSYIHSLSSLPWASSGWIGSHKWEYLLKSPRMCVMNHRRIKSSNLSVCVWKVDIVKIEPLVTWCRYAYHVDIEAISFRWLNFFKDQVASDKQQKTKTFKFLSVLINGSKIFVERSFVILPKFWLLDGTYINRCSVGNKEFLLDWLFLWKSIRTS